jgi:hypothetical protein
MMGGKDQRLSRLPLMLFVVIAGIPPLSYAQDKSSPALLLGGSFEKTPVHRFLPGSRRTILFPARVGSLGEITPLSNPPGIGGGSWEPFLKGARERSDLLLATMDPVMIRDSRGVIQMAVIHTDDPMTASCVLAPGFLRRFSAFFGPELIIAIPARNKIYVFPKLANRIPDTSQTIRDDYLISPMPVSSELFELSKKGIRAIGDLDPKG